MLAKLEAKHSALTSIVV